MIFCHECLDRKTCPDYHEPKYPSTVSTLGCLKDEEEQSPQTENAEASILSALLNAKSLIKIGEVNSLRGCTFTKFKRRLKDGEYDLFVLPDMEHEVILVNRAI